MYIESEGILYRGSGPDCPDEVWDYPRKKWVPYADAGPQQFGVWVEVDEARAESLKSDNPAAEHYMYYDTPPWAQPLSQEYHEAMMPPAIRRLRELRRAKGSGSAG